MWLGGDSGASVHGGKAAWDFVGRRNYKATIYDARCALSTARTIKGELHGRPGWASLSPFSWLVWASKEVASCGLGPHLAQLVKKPQAAEMKLVVIAITEVGRS